MDVPIHKVASFEIVDIPSPDRAFSRESQEFQTMVNGIRVADKILNQVAYEACGREARRHGSRSTAFTVKNMKRRQRSH